MATKIKTNTIDSQIDLIDQMVADATGIDLRKKAQDSIAERAALRSIGSQIAKAIGADMFDQTLILVKGGNISCRVH